MEIVCVRLPDFAASMQAQYSSALSDDFPKFANLAGGSDKVILGSCVYSACVYGPGPAQGTDDHRGLSINERSCGVA